MTGSARRPRCRSRETASARTATGMADGRLYDLCDGMIEKIEESIAIREGCDLADRLRHSMALRAMEEEMTA